MMLRIQTSPTYKPEREYINHILLKEFLGLEYQIEFQDRQNISITAPDKRELILPDILFQMPKDQWLTAASLPRQPLAVWDTGKMFPASPLVDPKIPIIYGDAGLKDFRISGTQQAKNADFNSIESIASTKSLIVPIDIFGSAFFMLSRYEEVVKLNRDEHDRFPATASLAFQEGFLDRPIINEYLEILWACLKQLWPELTRKKRQFRILSTHDVDAPFAHAFQSPLAMARSFAGDVIKRAAPLTAVKNMLNTLKVKAGRLEFDPFNTFDRIMDISERQGLRSSFYFITDHSAGRIDGDYSIHHPLIRQLMRHIHTRGHAIGLHTSYNTYKDTLQTKKEFENLTSVCEQEGIQQNQWGGRQHFLRWETPATFENWEHAGLDYDTTLSFADHAGFRCGICYEYPVFDIKSRRALKLRERPLIVMECTVMDERYQAMGAGEAAFEEMNKLKQRCRMFKGDFVLLWHNTRFVDEREAGLYERLLEG